MFKPGAKGKIAMGALQLRPEVGVVHAARRELHVSDGSREAVVVERQHSQEREVRKGRQGARQAFRPLPKMVGFQGDSLDPKWTW